MKKVLLIAAQLFFCYSVFASGETIAADVGSGPKTSGFPVQAPCASVLFEITSKTIPSGFTHVKQWDWYMSNVLVQTVTNANQNSISLDVHPDATSNCIVYCKVTYADDNGNVSAPSQSTSVNIPIGVSAVDGITQSGTAIPGCSNPVTFTTKLATGLGIFTPTNYTVNWSLPAGWSFSGPSTGLSVSVIPGLTPGTVSTSLSMPCGYSSLGASLSVPLITPAPTFSSANTANVCDGTTAQTFSINPVCGASSYTYTVSTFYPISGIVFTANGLQTLTTTGSSAEVGFPASGAGIVKLSVVANYPNNTASSPVTYNFSFGSPSSQAIGSLDNLTFCGDIPQKVFIINPSPGGFYAFSGTLSVVDGFGLNTSVHWSTTHTKLGGSNFVQNQDGSIFVSAKSKLNYYMGLECTTGNACGTYTASYLFGGIDCNSVNRIIPLTDSGVAKQLDMSGSPSQLSIFPNPVQDIVNVTLPDSIDIRNTLIRIIDMYGIPVRQIKVVAYTSNIPVSGLATGVYVVEIIEGNRSLITKKIVKN